METTTLTGMTSPAAQAPKPLPKTAIKDDFLRLFVTQLRYQDPLSPLDSAGFTAQLAQFSSLEQLTGIGARLEDLLLYQGALQNAIAAGLVGREVAFAGPDGTAGRGTVTGVAFENNRTWFVVDGATRVSPGEIREIH